MKCIVYSKAGQSTIFRKLQEKGSLIGDYRPKSSAQNQQQNKVLKKSIMTSGEDVDIEVEQELLQTEPVEYYKTKCQIMKDHIKQLQNGLQELEKDNDMLRNLNHDYVTQLNKLADGMLPELDKITIDKYFFECPAKKVIGIMEKNYKKLVREQKDFIDVCKVMQGEIEVYKTKMDVANSIIDGLRKTGESSIDSLVQRLTDLTEQNDDLQQLNKELSYDIALKSEKIENYENKIMDSEQQRFDELILKHNKLQNEFEQTKNADRKQMYMLRCENEFHEQELRALQVGLFNANQDKNQQVMKNKELESANETMRHSVNNFYQSQREAKNTFRNGCAPNVTFK